MRIVRQLLPDASAELWRDPTSVVSIVETPLHADWIGQPLRVLEDNAGTRAAFVMRFGLGILPTGSTVLQDGDQLFMLVTDDIAAGVRKVTGAPPPTH
jgi:trk system potassium uptake protein TrkA